MSITYRKYLFFLTSYLSCYASAQIVGCYYGSWSVYAEGNGNFQIENIDTSLCTHFFYSFAGISENGDVVVDDPDNDLPDGNDGYRRFVNLKNQNSDLKIMLSIGGASESSAKFSRVIDNANLRKKFVKNATKFLKTYGFDGLDMDWEYPAQNGGGDKDKENFSKLLQELREEFDNHGYILSAAVAADPDSVETSYDIPKVSRYLDIINIMTYDFHGSWDSVTGNNAPLYPGDADDDDYARTLNVDASIQNWIAGGAAPEKIVMGCPLYGRSFTLDDSSDNGVGASASQPGKPGPYTQEPGTLGYNEICEMQRDGGWDTIWDDKQKVPYSIKGDQWVGYDNVKSLKIKAQYARDNGLAGMMVWSVDQDDFGGICGDKYPLLNVINEGLGRF